MGRLRGAGVLLSVLLVILLPGIAHSAGTISGKITRLSNGLPIAGAPVTVAAPSRWSALRRLTRARDVQPALAVDANGVRHIVFRRRSGGRRGLFALRWTRTRSLARIPGTTSADLEPALSTSGSQVILAFARPSGRSPGIYHDRRTGAGRWLPRPRRWSAGARDRSVSLRADNRGRVGGL